MKKFIVKLLLFISLFCISDWVIGGVFKLYDFTKSGRIHKFYILMTKQSPDLLILGSSRASHHYNPIIIGDSLKLDTFNAGFDGMGTYVGYGILTGVARRKFPEYILCDISPKFDIYDKNGTARGIDNFYPYTFIPQIKDLMTDFDQNEKWKMLSNAYRLNSSIVKIISSVFTASDDYIAGFLPLSGKLKIETNDKKIKNGNSPMKKIDPVKEKYLRKLIESAQSNGTKIVFTISPIYGGGDINSFKDELQILAEYDVPVLNHLNDSLLIGNMNYFQDRTHMNRDGADVYSKIIAKELLNYVNIPVQ